MIRLAMTMVKFFAIATIVLVLGQIPVGQKRITDHVRDVIQSSSIQKPVHWIAARFNPVAGYHAMTGTEKGETGRGEDSSSHAAGSEHTKSDRARLSGLLKR